MYQEGQKVKIMGEWYEIESIRHSILGSNADSIALGKADYLVVNANRRGWINEKYIEIVKE